MEVEPATVASTLVHPSSNAAPDFTASSIVPSAVASSKQDRQALEKEAQAKHELRKREIEQREKEARQRIQHEMDALSAKEAGIQRLQSENEKQLHALALGSTRRAEEMALLETRRQEIDALSSQQTDQACKNTQSLLAERVQIKQRESALVEEEKKCGAAMERLQQEANKQAKAQEQITEGFAELRRKEQELAQKKEAFERAVQNNPSFVTAPTSLVGKKRRVVEQEPSNSFGPPNPNATEDWIKEQKSVAKEEGTLQIAGNDDELEISMEPASPDGGEDNDSHVVGEQGRKLLLQGVDEVWNAEHDDLPYFSDAETEK